MKLIKSQMPLKKRNFTDINEIDSQPKKESINDEFSESDYYSNPEDESYITSNKYSNN